MSADAGMQVKPQGPPLRPAEVAAQARFHHLLAERPAFAAHALPQLARQRRIAELLALPPHLHTTLADLLASVRCQLLAQSASMVAEQDHSPSYIAISKAVPSLVHETHPNWWRS